MAGALPICLIWILPRFSVIFFTVAGLPDFTGNPNLLPANRLKWKRHIDVRRARLRDRSLGEGSFNP